MVAELDARAIVTSLAGRQISTATGRPNTVLAVDDASALVGTTRSPDGELVPIQAVQDGIDPLAEAGVVEVRHSTGASAAALRPSEVGNVVTLVERHRSRHAESPPLN